MKKEEVTDKTDKFDKDNYELATLFCLRMPQEIRNKIQYSESEFRQGLATLLPRNCKKFYCYWILDEIEKLGTNILRTWKTIQNERNTLKKRNDDRIARNILQAIVDEQHLWSRKLIELVVHLILFSKSSKEIYFEHYILINRHQSYHRRYNSYNDFFSCSCIRDKEQQKKLESRIVAIENMSGFNINRAWYLDSQKIWAQSTTKNKSKHKDFRKLLLDALAIAKPDQKIILGGSYENFSRLSRSLHPNIGGPTFPVSLDMILINIMYNSLLAGHIQLMIKRLLNLRAKSGPLLVLQHTLVKNKYPVQLFRNVMQPKIEKGDFVIVRDEICEVIKVTKNKFGYRSFTVSFLERPNNHPCKKDDYLGNELMSVAKRQKLIEDTKKIVLEADPNAKLHGNSFIKSYREGAIRLWNLIKSAQK